MVRQENANRHRARRCAKGSDHVIKSCCDKIAFADFTDAEKALSKYMSRIIFSTMTVYSCVTHHGFHLGHDRLMIPSEVVRRYQLPQLLSNQIEVIDPLQLTNYTGSTEGQCSVGR